jgi:hypothetical protein
MNDNESRKVALFVCHELVGLLMLNKVVPAMKEIGLEPVIFNTTTNRNRKPRNPTPRIVEALGGRVLDSVILPFLEKERNDGEPPNLTYRQLARKHGLQYHEIGDVNDPALVKRLADDKSFVGAVSLRFMLVFEKPIIDVFREKGFMWNLHSGLLPGYRGMLIPYRVIENGEKEYGLTLHETVAGIDEGDIVATGALPLDPDRPVLDLYLDTVDTAADMLTATLSQVAQGRTPKGVPQSGASGYYSNPTTEEFGRFLGRGIFYIDPVDTIQRIADAFARPGTPDNAVLNEALMAFLEGREERRVAIASAVETQAAG